MVTVSHDKSGHDNHKAIFSAKLHGKFKFDTSFYRGGQAEQDVWFKKISNFFSKIGSLKIVSHGKVTISMSILDPILIVWEKLAKELSFESVFSVVNNSKET